MTFYLKLISPYIRIYLSTCLFMAASLFSTKGSCQQGKVHFNNHTVSDGLSSNTIYDIAKDKYGFIWIATEDGLNRFDGTNFNVYRNKNDDPTSLRANHITAVYEDRLGQLWIGTCGGALSLYNRRNDAFENFEFTAGNQRISEAITGMTEDSRGNLWVASYNGLYKVQVENKNILQVQIKGQRQSDAMLSIYRDHRDWIWIGTSDGLLLFDPRTNNTTRFEHQENNPASLANNHVLSIAEDRNGNIWAGTQDGLSMLLPNLKGFRNYRKSADNKNGLSNNYIHAIKADENNHLWIGTDGGLNILDIKHDRFSVYHPDERTNGGLSSESIRAVYFDNHGICWLGTYQGGLNKFDRNFTHFNHKQRNAFDNQGLSAAVVTSFAEGGIDNLYVGTDGGGLNLFHPSSSRFDHIQITPSKTNERPKLSIMGLEMTSENILWISTYFDGLFAYDRKTGNYRQYIKEKGPLGLSSNNVFCTKVDRSGNVWIGTDGGGINMLDRSLHTMRLFVNPTSKPDNPFYPSNNVIRAIEEDKSGCIWIGTFGAGISVFDPVKQRFRFYNKGNSYLPNNYVLTIFNDINGQLWVGTNGGGISLFDAEHGKFRTFSEKDGLANDVIHKILEDNQGKIWASTNKGLSSLDKRTFRITNYNAQNGLQSSPFVLGSGISLSNGEIYFGGQNGINYFSPSDIKKNMRKPEIALIDLMVDNKRITPSENGPIMEPILRATKIKLNYRQNFVIGFVALNYTNPSQNQYEYKLDGVDKEWIRAGKDHQASYTNLSPGEYIFHIRASNNDGIWNEKAKTIKITVMPPFWLTPFAFFLYIAVITGAIMYARYKGIRKLKAQFLIEQERQQARQLIEQERSNAENERKLDQMKIKFLTNLSHEFRTPISLIMGPVEKLLSGDFSHEIKFQLDLVKRNGQRLLNLVNHLLDFRKLEKEELTLTLNPGDINAFLADIAASFIYLAEQKNINYVIRPSQACPNVLFDASKLERVLFNLLSNAFKFTREGGRVELQFSFKQLSDDKVLLDCRVEDTGVGINTSELPFIFNRFYQTDGNPTMLNQGSGIGLSIAREFVRMHGGSLRADSIPGLGSTFSFDVPLSMVTDRIWAEKAEADTFDAGENPVTPVSEQSLLLIVEDDPDFRFFLKDNLQSEYRIAEATNGKEGWQQALSLHPDMIISDVNMPEMDGVALSKKLKSDKRTLHIPLILLTASNAEVDELRGLESEANDFITKPFNFAVLLVKIRNLLSLNEKLKATYSRLLKITLDEIDIEPEEERFLKSVVLYIEKNLTDPQLSVDALSRELCISRVSLYKKILEVTGLAPVEFIRSVKLEKAVQLMEKSDMKVAQIAYHVGFSTPNYFSKSFRDKYHMSPSEYINNKRHTQEKHVSA